jgi:ATP-dependent DNA helicase RecG
LIVAESPGLNTAALVARSDKPQRTIERWLKQLKDQGHIEFRGAPKTGGYHPKQHN